MQWTLLGALLTSSASAQDPVPEPARAPSRPWATPGKVRALAFVPVPGFPSLVQGDLGNAGLSLALTAPVVALWVGATSRTAEWDAERWGVAAGGAYAATVIINQVTGMRSYRRGQPAVAVMPRPDGGAMVSLHLAL